MIFFYNKNPNNDQYLEKWFVPNKRFLIFIEFFKPNDNNFKDLFVKWFIPKSINYKFLFFYNKNLNYYHSSENLFAAKRIFFSLNEFFKPYEISFNP